MDLPIELKSPRKGLINIKNKDKICFLWCHVKHINPSKEHPERILKVDKKLLENLIIMELSVQGKEKILTRLKWKIIYPLICYENGLVFPVYVSDQKWICCF